VHIYTLQALELLEPLLDDKTDFVRQGAMMATAMLIAPLKPEADPRSKKFREKLLTVVADSKVRREFPFTFRSEYWNRHFLCAL
jgi:hypothetical protein